MTINVTRNNGTSTVTLEYTANTAKINGILLNAAMELWDRGLGDHGPEESPIEFNDLTNQEKLDLIDSYVKRVVQDLAAEHYREDELDAAGETAAAYIFSNLRF